MLNYLVIIFTFQSFTNTIQDILKCPRNHFSSGELGSCRPHLNCGDLDDMTFVRRLGSGAVKDVFLVDWNNIPIALSVPVDSKVLEDFMNGVETLRLLNPSKYVVQYLGFCETKYALFSEYHLNGDAAALFNSSKYKLSLKQSVGYCHQYAEILNFLHNIPVGGPRVFCDSNSLEKLLSQLLVTTDFKLILNDVDALPQVVNGSGIKCGHRQLFGTFVAPEQLWNSSDQFDDSVMTGYDEKTDIWKAPAVCEYFLNLAEDAEILKYRLFDLHKRCRNIEPSRRPCVNELVDEYQRVFDELDNHSEL